jgi:DNA-binding MarR family transcriptional regulator
MKRSASSELRRLTNHVRRKLMTFEGAADGRRQTSSHYYIISYIASMDKKPVFQRDIDKTFSLRRPTTTEILKLMERNGLIRKESVENDLRLKRVVLTPKAKKINSDFEMFLDNMEDEMKSGISEEDMETFFNVVMTMRQNLENSESENK